jgi:hypothetical protein
LRSPHQSLSHLSHLSHLSMGQMSHPCPTLSHLSRRTERHGNVSENVATANGRRRKAMVDKIDALRVDLIELARLIEKNEARTAALAVEGDPQLPALEDEIECLRSMVVGLIARAGRLVLRT